MGVILLFSQHTYNVDVTSTFQETAVSAACRRGHLSIVRYLIHRGADLSVCDKSGFSCLRWAAKHRNKPLVRLLLQRGVSVRKDCSSSYHSALDWARENHDEDIEGMLMAVLIEEKRNQRTKLQQAAAGNETGIPARAATAVVVKTSQDIKEEQRQERVDQAARDRDTAFRERVDVLYNKQTVQDIKRFRPMEESESPVPMAETEWRKKKAMTWERVAVPPKPQEPASPHVDMNRIRQLIAIDGVEDGGMLDIDAMAMFAQKAKPKPASLQFYCPDFE
ncbi:hypothetical protein, variant [Aphanomyces invadans]|nr:hypothetical protein, variant [Aphanomyces invadans]ETV98234.1 hypothetical protein, variant [Aphanomyces invadans]|eukprot:XP_008873109.1 hypothetical protein, variant [Aphanomyces invadans]